MERTKPVLSFRVDKETVEWIDGYTAKTGKPRIDIFKEAITLFRKERETEQRVS